MRPVCTLGASPFFVSVASKELRIEVNGLESTLTGCLISVDSKGACVAPELCNCCLGSLLALDLELGSRNCRQMYLLDRVLESERSVKRKDSGLHAKGAAGSPSLRCHFTVRVS